MISQKTLKAIEFNKILNSVAQFAVLSRTKEQIIASSPLTSLKEIEFLQSKTLEAYHLLYKHSIGGVYYFDNVNDELDRADKGGTLNNAELLRVGSNLKGARIIKNAVLSVNDEVDSRNS